MNRIQEKDLRTILDNTDKLFNDGFVKGASIFITGATGFFGKWLLESFLYLNKELSLNVNICALSRNPENFLEEFPFYKNEKCLTWIKGDIRTFKFPKEQFEYIIHAATDADANLNSDNPLLMIDTITEGTKRVLEFAKNQTVLKAFLLTSSGAVYGKQPENITHIKETDNFFIDINNPGSAYAEGKRLSELFCSIYAKQYSIPLKIARCFAFVGPYLPLNKHFAIGNFISNVLLNQNIIIKGDGTPLRSYMYASDLIIWLLTILLKGEVNIPYNVGSGRAISILDLAFLVNGFLPYPKEVKVIGLHNNKPKEQYVPDVSRSLDNLNLHLTISLEESIQKTISFYKQKC